MTNIDGWSIFWGILGWVLAVILAVAVAVIVAGVILGIARSIRRAVRKEMSEATRLKHQARAKEIYEAAHQVGKALYNDQWFDPEGKAMAFAKGARWTYLRDHDINQ